MLFYGLNNIIVDYDIVCKMCVLNFVLGLLLVCEGYVIVLLFGGCVIGVCLMDIYISVFEVLGVEIEFKDGYLYVKVLSGGLKGGLVKMWFVLVGVMENILMVVMLVKGMMIIENLVCELEIVDLVDCLWKMGV